MQPVNLVRIFIASPDDVAAERDAAVQVTHEWNAAHSLDRRAAIEAVRIETHAEAALGCHPQDLLNGQLLGRCDLLIAIFSSRLGTATPNAASGTVDEIKHFSKRTGAENVLLFFGTDSIPRDVDPDELKRLNTFKDSMKNKGLYIPFKGVEDFKQKLRQQLEMRLNKFALPEGVLVSRAAPMVALDSDGGGTRIDEYRSLRARATRSLYVMGVGMTLFSADVTLMRALMKKGLSVRLLMIDPTVIASSRRRRSRSDSPDFTVMEQAFSEYFARKCYGDDVHASLSRLKAIVAEAAKTEKSGRVELRTYPFFLPMNFTAIDEAHDGQVLLEFCLPFSDQRLRMLLVKNRDCELFPRVIENCERLWQMSTPVASANVKRRPK